jgi:hypothetical protein
MAKKESEGTVAVRFNVTITEQDIERAHRDNSYKCVVAQALARTIPSAANIEVDTQTIRFTIGGERRIYLTPYAVQGYVIAFDAGDPIEPFRFHLRNPRRVSRNVRTEAGNIAERASSKARRAKQAPAEVLPATTQSAPAKTEAVPLAQDSETVNERRRAAYTEARKENPEPFRHADGGGRKAPPRVFKTKRRSYGQRQLRINREGGGLFV